MNETVAAFEALAGVDRVDEYMKMYDAIKWRMQHPDNNLANVDYWPEQRDLHNAVISILKLIKEEENGRHGNQQGH